MVIAGSTCKCAISFLKFSYSRVFNGLTGVLLKVLYIFILSRLKLRKLIKWSKSAYSISMFDEVSRARSYWVTERCMDYYSWALLKRQMLSNMHKKKTTWKYLAWSDSKYEYLPPNSCSPWAYEVEQVSYV